MEKEKMENGGLAFLGDYFFIFFVTFTAIGNYNNEINNF